jgi:hypothetical protein
MLDPNAPLPTFFIVGAPKAGTTSLYAYLRQHPQVFMSKRKEPHYFSTFQVESAFDNFVPAIKEPHAYQDLFRGSDGYKAIGEASSSYLSDVSAASRIFSVIPDAKILISLRNPVERAFSHYLMECREGRERRTFAEAVAADQARNPKGWGVSVQYVELGLYADQVERYIDVFGRSNVKVIIFEEFVRDTAKIMREVALFLGVDAERFPISVLDDVYHQFAATRGPYARWILRCKPLRMWTRRWIPQGFRRAIRDRFLFREAVKPSIDAPFRYSLAERFTADLQRLETLLERNLGSLREYH